MSIPSNKLSGTTNVPLSVKQASNNNDQYANVIFMVMTSLVILGSTYLYYYLPDYMKTVSEKYPEYAFPEYSDYLIAIAVIPIFVVSFMFNR